MICILMLTGCRVETADEHDRRISSEAEESTAHILVHITVTCSDVLGKDNLNTSADIPDDGIFLDKEIAVKPDSSVFDVLDYALADSGLSYSGNRGYISGICGLNERECGRFSGWMYKVNDVSPNVGCGGYILSDGDNVIWYYNVSD